MRDNWLGPSELRVGLGCMRLSTDEDRDEERALATIAAAAASGVTVFDTAHAYGLGPEELGHNERLLVRALRACGRLERARIVTKGGMTRKGDAWAPDGRAKTLRAHCEESLAALDGAAIDLYLLHAPDPRTPWRTSVRALARLAEEGLVRRVGLSNVNRMQLDEALELAPITAVQVAVSPFEDRALRGGVVDRCAERGIVLIAHSPLGGPRLAPRLPRDRLLSEVADAHGATAAEIALAWLLSLGPHVLAIPGARRPGTARSAARAAGIALTTRERAALDRAFGAARPASTGARRRSRRDGGEVVLVMGVPGAGKSRLAEELVARGYLRLNRDERGGSLRGLTYALDETLEAGARQVVLDNTYLTRASRSYVLETASRHGLPARCVWLDTPLAQAQVNMVVRLLDRYGEIPAPDRLAEVARREPGVLTPTRQMRAFRELEPPTDNEGFASVERVAWARARGEGAAGVFVAASAIARLPAADTDPSAPHLVFDWRPGGGVGELDDALSKVAGMVAGPVEATVCPHPGGAPICWCRPPLPGLPLAFARKHGVDPARSILVGSSTAHRTLAKVLGARFVEA